MRFYDFHKTFSAYPVFSRIEIAKHFPDFAPRNLVRWQEKGYVKKVRNNWYCFSEREFDERQLFWVSNQIYAPSYISLETALSHYGLIPERVFTIQGLTTRKTQYFETPIGNFYYQSIRPSLNFGYRLQKTGNLYFKIADPAKALLDLLYLRPELKSPGHIEELRLNRFELDQVLDLGLLQKWLAAFDNRALERRVDALVQWLNNPDAYALSS